MVMPRLRWSRAFVLNTAVSLGIASQASPALYAQAPEDARRPPANQLNDVNQPVTLPVEEITPAKDAIPATSGNAERPIVLSMDEAAAPSGARDRMVPPTVYVLPQQPEPNWIDLAGNELVEEEEVRTQLKSRLDNFRIENIPLTDALQSLSEKSGVTILIDRIDMDNQGVNLGQNVSFRSQTASLRQVLLWMFRGISEAQLTNKVEENAIVVVTREKAVSEPSTRHYDLAYILPNSSNVRALMSAIQENFDSDNWALNGGTFSMSMVGTLLVVSADEETHYKIERLLARIRIMDRGNLEAPPAIQSGLQILPNAEAGKGMVGGGLF